MTQALRGQHQLTIEQISISTIKSLGNASVFLDEAFTSLTDEAPLLSNTVGKTAVTMKQINNNSNKTKQIRC